MSTFAIIMFAATLFFAYQIFRHVQSLEDTTSADSMNPVPLVDPNELVGEADDAYQNGDLAAAREKLQQAYALVPDDIEIVNKLAFVHGKLEEPEEAIRLYALSLQMDDTDDLTHNALASLYRAQGSLTLAKEHYEKALRIDDTYAVTYYNYGNLLGDLGEKQEAEAMYLKAIELDRDLTEARSALEALRAAE